MKKLLCLCLVVLASALSRAAQQAPAAPAGSPVLAPSDLLSIRVYGEAELTQEVRISREYTISLMLIKQVNLNGKTARQAEELIRDLYNRDFLVNPQVSLIVKEYSKRTVNVLGEVNRPGPVSFPLEQGLTLIEAIGLAGGTNQIAKLSTVRIVRVAPDGKQETQIVNFGDLLKGKTSNSGGKSDFPLQVNDTVWVDQIGVLN